MNQNSPRGCAARGDEVYAEHTARARKCTASAHFFILQIVTLCYDGESKFSFGGEYLCRILLRMRSTKF